MDDVLLRSPVRKAAFQACFSHTPSSGLVQVANDAGNGAILKDEIYLAADLSDNKFCYRHPLKTSSLAANVQSFF